MIDQLTLDIQLRADWQFDNFMIGDNHQLIEHLTSIKQQSSTFLWGSEGCGKTHLLNALCQRYQLNYPKAVVIYLPLNSTYQIPSESLQGMEQCDLVCIDDVDSVIGDEQWEQALFHFINRMNDLGKSYVLCSSQTVNHITYHLPDLKSRFGAMLNFEIMPLNVDQSVDVFNLKAKELGINLDNDVLAYITKRGPRHLKKLLELLNTLDAESLKAKKAITVPFLKQHVTW